MAPPILMLQNYTSRSQSREFGGMFSKSFEIYLLPQRREFRVFFKGFLVFYAILRFYFQNLTGCPAAKTKSWGDSDQVLL